MSERCACGCPMDRCDDAVTDTHHAMLLGGPFDGRRIEVTAKPSLPEYPSDKVRIMGQSGDHTYVRDRRPQSDGTWLYRVES